MDLGTLSEILEGVSRAPCRGNKICVSEKVIAELVNLGAEIIEEDVPEQKDEQFTTVRVGSVTFTHLEKRITNNTFVPRKTHVLRELEPCSF
jgi:hypothetical protein